MSKRKQVPTLSFEKLSLFKKLDNGKTAKLSWGIRGDYPRITVFTNTKETSNVYDNLIIAPMDGVILKSLLLMMNNTIEEQCEGIISIDCLNKKWVNGLSTDEVCIQATINIEHNEQGLLNISLTSEGKDEVLFTIGEHLWHVLKPNKTMSDEDFSRYISLAYVGQLESLYTKYLNDVYEENIKIYTPAENKPKLVVDNTINDLNKWDDDVDAVIEKHRIK